MSFACVQNYLSTQFQTFQITNGECRFLRAPGADETDAQGFVSLAFVARTVGFLPCLWSPVKADKTSEDSDVALQVRSTAVYEITIGQSSAGTFLPSDRIELRTKPDDPASVMTCDHSRRQSEQHCMAHPGCESRRQQVRIRRSSKLERIIRATETHMIRTISAATEAGLQSMKRDVPVDTGDLKSTCQKRDDGF